MCKNEYMTIIDEKFLKYENKWVAIRKDTSIVLAASKSFKTLYRKLEKLNRNDVFATFITPFDKYLTV